MSLFDAVAAEYAATRPGYPAELLDAVEEHAGGYRGRRVLDLAAGTGIATAGLRGRGARVTACDLGHAMLRRLRADQRAVPAVVGRAERLPFRADAFDAATCGTAWHWVDPVAGGAELLRVLRPGGAFAAFWAIAQLEPPGEWERAQSEVFERWGLQRGPAAQVARDVAAGCADGLRRSGFADVVTGVAHWARVVSRDEHVRHLGTHSNVIGLGGRAQAFLADVRAALAGHERVVERFVGPWIAGRAP